MKKSIEKTDFIILRAGSQHPMESVDFAIVNCSLNWYPTALKLHQFAVLENNDDLSFAVVYTDSPIYFYSCCDDLDLDTLLPNGTEWAFLDATVEQIECLDQRHGDLNEIMLKLDHYGSACFIAKDDYDDYYSETFDLNSMMALL